MKAKTLVGILAVTIALLTHARAQVPFTNSLVAYFPFSGNGNDASGNGNNGTLFGAATFGVDRFGNANSCLSLPGTAGVGSGVDVPSLTSMSYEPVTYSAWFLVNSYPLFPSDIAVMALVGRDECGSQSQGDFCIFSGSTVSNNLGYFWGKNGDFTQTVPPTNQWCQGVLTIDQTGNANFYLNGTNVSSTGPAAPAGQPLDFRIGASASGGCGGEDRYVWNGLIDDVRVYNVVLSASQVQQLYAYESPSLTNPVIITQPQSQIAFVGANVSFATSATGATPLSYQWQFDGTNLANATNFSVTLTRKNSNLRFVDMRDSNSIYFFPFASTGMTPPPKCPPTHTG